MGWTWRFACGLALALGLLVGARWPEAGAVPRANPGRAVYLPVVRYVGDSNAGVETSIQVQNLGDRSTQVAMFIWREYSGGCESQPPGPIAHRCSGLLTPGSTWIWNTGQLPGDAKSAILYPVYSCPGALDLPPGELQPLPLAASVVRRASVGGASGADVSASYPGIPDWMLGSYDESFGGFGYYAPRVEADPDGLSTWLYIQNGGDTCTSVELWFKSQDDCLRAQICDLASLPPGETYQFDASRCVAPGFRGSAWIRSSQPLAVAIDAVSRGILMSYTGRPVQLDAPWADRPVSSGGSQVLYGPLLYREQQGWDTTVQVQNLSSVLNAKVKVYFFDAFGNPITSLVDWVCPRGSQTFFLPVVNNLPGNYTGQVRVESVNWISPGDASAPSANLTGVAELVRYEGPARSNMLEGIAYNLVAEWEAFDWPGGENSLFDTGVTAITSLSRSGVGNNVALAVQNIVPVPGTIDYALLIYDQNGLVGSTCRRLGARESEYVNVDSWSFVSPGFRGSAVISASRSTQLGPGGRPLFGLAAVQVERSGVALGIDIPGDGSTGSEGVPAPRWWTTRWDTPFDDPRAPACPP